MEILTKYAPLLANGLLQTAWITLLGASCALLAALLLNVATSSGMRLLMAAVRIYTELILGLPILVLLYLLYFAGPNFGLRLSAMTTGVATLTLYYSPYMAEAIRAAIAAVPKGQIEAGRSLAMSGLAIARHLIWPQALGLMLPTLTGLLIGLAKDTAILSVISVKELAYFTKQVVSRTYMPFEVWAGVVLVYWICLSLLELVLRGLEHRVSRYRRV